MKNFIQPGNSLDLALPYDRLSGEAFLILNILAVSSVTKLSGELVSGAVEGVYEIKKRTVDVMPVGTKVNWNDSNKELQLATTDLDNAATVIKAANGSVSLVQVKLTPV